MYPTDVLYWLHVPNPCFVLVTCTQPMFTMKLKLDLVVLGDLHYVPVETG